jgi:16S rRNA pseudouridine516 synthase
MQKYKLTRSEAEKAIKGGQILLDGKAVTECGLRISTERHVELLPKAQEEELIVYALNKPVGVLSKPEPNSGPFLLELLPVHPQPLFVSGRLDKDSSGLIIISNNGRFYHLSSLIIS